MMCRSIKVLRGFEAPATDAEVQEAALQYVRKVSGFRSPSVKNAEAFQTAVETVALATRALLDQMPPLKSPIVSKRTNRRRLE